MLEKRVSKNLWDDHFFWFNFMTCCSGFNHTVTVSDNGKVYSFGLNRSGQLGLSKQADNISVPRHISSLPKIKMVSCGYYFTICVDYEGYMWSFGNNMGGQLGTGNLRNVIHPQKILELPPVQSVACGAHHTLILTKEGNIWSCGGIYMDNYALKTKQIN